MYKLAIQKLEAKICLDVRFILSLLVKFSKIIIEERYLGDPVRIDLFDSRSRIIALDRR